MKPLRSRKKNAGAGALSLKTLGAAKRVLLLSLPYVLSLALLGTLLGSVVAYAVNSGTFQLSEVKILNIGTLTQDQAFRFCELQKGENLIALDLVNVQEVIKRKHPEFKEVRVRRVLPNRVEVLLKRRTPVVQLAAFSRYVQIDRDKIVLPGSGTLPFRNLTIIQGAPLPRRGLAVGTTLKDSWTVKAMMVADLVKRSGVLRRHVLTRVDISDPRNLSLIVDDAVEIRLGDGHFVERLKILDQTLRTIDLDPSKIRYMDLRFDDIILGTREAENGRP